jgi:ribonuclease BN (tRNA processing enzyme)
MLLAVYALSILAQSAAPQASALQPSAITQVVMLGTGTPIPDPAHQGPSTAIIVNGQSYVVDCGPGVVRQAASATRKGFEGLKMPNLTRLFITHLHTDHTTGLPDFIFTPAITGRREPLEIYGPGGTGRMVDLIKQAWQEDYEIRMHGGENGNPTAYIVHVHEIEPGVIYQDKNVKVTAFAVLHGKWKEAYGYRFDTPDRVIVVSGDTTYCPNLVANAKGCDILIHEVYSEDGLERLAPDQQAYHKAYHTSGPQVGIIASQVQPKLLILYHELRFGSAPGEIVTEIRRVYGGPVVEAADLDRY